MTLFIEYPSWLHPEVIPGVPFLRWYSLAYLFGFLITYLLIRRNIRMGLFPYTEADLSSLVNWSIIGMLLGSRLTYVIFYETDSSYYLLRPWLIYWPFRNGQFVGLSGLSYHGGLIGITATLILFCWRKRQNFYTWTDISAAAVPLGYTLGRMANFINAELYGRATALPWGVKFPTAEALPSSLPWVKDIAVKIGISLENLRVNLPRHPSQLYEAFFEGFVTWLILYVFLRPRVKTPGVISWSYLILYGGFRFFLEYFRQPDAQLGYIIEAVSGDYRTFVSLFNISMGQILSFAMLVVGIIGVSFSIKRPKVPQNS